MSLVLSHVTKTYPNGVRALDDLSLTIETGMYGLLGPNGAGKSSLMRTIAALQEPDSGSLTLDGVDIVKNKEAVRHRLGYLPQEFGFYPTLTAEAQLDHFALIKGIGDRKVRRDTVSALLAQVNLSENKNKRVGGFSGGMRQRLGIATALLGNPYLIIVDEPTAGLDPTERNRFLNLLAEIGTDRIVILSTHIVEDVRELCPRMAIIARGRVAAEGAPEAVIDGVRGKLWERAVDRSEIAGLKAALPVVATKLHAGVPHLTVAMPTAPAPGWKPVVPDLEDAYFYYTGASTDVSTHAAPPTASPTVPAVAPASLAV